MRCPNCNAEVPDDKEYCPNCGYRLDEEEEKITDNSILGKLNNYFKRSNTLSKIMSIIVILFILSFVVAFVFNSKISLVISLIQLVLVCMAFMVEKGVIKISDISKYILVLLSVVMIAPYVFFFSGEIHLFGERINWDDIVLSDIIPDPDSTYGEIYDNSRDGLYMYVYKINSKEFDDYMEECKDEGFTVDLEQTGYSLDAYNSEGYKLSLYFYDYSEEMRIDLDKPMTLKTIEWPDATLSHLIPIPKSTLGSIINNDSHEFSVYIGNMPYEDYTQYVDSCKENGFDLKSSSTEKTYIAKNKDSNALSIEYVGYNIMRISVQEVKYDVIITAKCKNSSKYNIDILIDGDYEGLIWEDESEELDLDLTPGEHTIKFKASGKSSISTETTFTITDDNELSYTIKCSDDKIKIVSK